MLKRLILGVVAAMFIVFDLFVNTAAAVQVDEEIRTVTLNEAGEEVTLTETEAELGKRLFNNVCSQCHAGGRTKTNPNVGIGIETLKYAEPPRDNVLNLAEYMRNPTTYDGEQELYLLHPNTTRADLWPEMRNLTDGELEAIAGYILIQPKVRGVMWGGGKVYN
ncbi:MAG: photosystem II cytochrome c-550 [Cyanobacteria bacterium P01_H01_bin.15]